MTNEQIETALLKQWEVKSVKMDWVGMETLLQHILTSKTLTPEQQLAATRECIDAYTRRGAYLDYPYFSPPEVSE